jgi:hypothetical protein
MKINPPRTQQRTLVVTLRSLPIPWVQFEISNFQFQLSIFNPHAPVTHHASRITHSRLTNSVTAREQTSRLASRPVSSEMVSKHIVISKIATSVSEAGFSSPGNGG